MQERHFRVSTPSHAGIPRKIRAKNDTILDELDSTTIDAGQGTAEIPVVLDGKRIKLGFTGKHAIDIKTALGIAGDERSEAD